MIKCFFMLNSTEHNFQLLMNSKTLKIKPFLVDILFLIMLINVKVPIIVAILKFMSKIKFMLSLVEHEKSVITSWKDQLPQPLRT